MELSEELKELCRQASIEMDHKKLSKLTERILELLAEREQKVKNSPITSISPRRPSL